MNSIDDFRRERDAALLTLDAATIRAFADKWNARLPTGDEVFWIAVHKARTAAVSLPIDARRFSKQWLTERGYTSFDDGDL